MQFNGIVRIHSMLHYDGLQEKLLRQTWSKHSGKCGRSKHIIISMENKQEKLLRQTWSKHSGKCGRSKFISNGCDGNTRVGNTRDTNGGNARAWSTLGLEMLGCKWRQCTHMIDTRVGNTRDANGSNARAWSTLGLEMLGMQMVAMRAHDRH